MQIRLQFEVLGQIFMFELFYLFDFALFIRLTEYLTDNVGAVVEKKIWVTSGPNSISPNILSPNSFYCLLLISLSSFCVWLPTMISCRFRWYIMCWKSFQAFYAQDWLKCMVLGSQLGIDLHNLSADSTHIIISFFFNYNWYVLP